MEKVVFLGASKGLGHAVASQWISKSLCCDALMVARTQEPMIEIASQSPSNHQVFPCDLATSSAIPGLVQEIQAFEPHRIFYFAGGGPFGTFEKKEWKDHQWALQLSFLTPAEIIHHFCRNPIESLKQIVVIGSKIADNKPDPNAASYAAAKHGLRGLINSLQEEEIAQRIDLRLFRPGYMDTNLLPPNAKPRKTNQPLPTAKEMANQFTTWVRDPKAAKTKTIED